MAARPPRPRSKDADDGEQLDVNARVLRLERSVSEQLLELRHGQQTHGSAISAMQSDMHKLVTIAEKQIEMQIESRQQSTAIERAFGDIRANREELLASLNRTREDQTKAIREGLDTFTRWRESHESKNQRVSDIVNSHSTGVRIIWAVFGLAAVTSSAWIFLSLQNIEQRIEVTRQNLNDRIQERAQLVDSIYRQYETRLERLEAERNRERR